MKETRIILTLIIITVQTALFSQDSDSTNFGRHIELLETQLIFYTDNPDTVVLRSDAVNYMEVTTGIKAEVWVNFAFIQLFSKEDIYKWKEWGRKNGYIE